MKDLSKIYLLAFLVFADVVAFAGPGGNTVDGGLDDEETPQAPINTYLIFMIGLALIFDFYALRKYSKQIKE